VRITRLHLRDLKRHVDQTIEPAPGLTVIRGPNEAGKTTIQRALELALYRRCTAAGAEIEELRRWGAGDDARPVVEMEFEDDGRNGRLVKNFRGAKGTVSLTIGEETTTDPAQADTWLAELTGIPTVEFFRSTASVRHHEVFRLVGDEGNLRDRLQASISGAERGVSVARKRLDGAIRGLKTAGPKNPGPIKQAEDEKARLEVELRRGEEALGRLERDREIHVSALVRHQAADAAVAGSKEQLRQAELAIRLTAERAEAEARYAKYREASEIRAQTSELERTHPSKIALPVLRTQVGRLRSLELEITEYRADLAADEEIPLLELPEPRWKPIVYAGVLLFVIGLAVYGALAFQLIGRVIVGVALEPLAGLVVSLVGILVLLYAWRRRDWGKDVRRLNQMREKQIERRLRGRSEVEQKLKDAERVRDRLLAEIVQSDVPAAEALLAAEEEHLHKIALLRARYEQLMRDDPRTDVERARDEAAAEAERKAAALAGMGEIGREPGRAKERFEGRLRTETDERDSAVRGEAAAAARVGQNDVDALVVAAASEALTEVTERLAALQRRLRVQETVLAALDAAETATMKKATRFLEQRMGRDIERITGGRYRRIQVEDDLEMRVWSPERGDWVPAAQLSQGTLDQLYLAARVELVRLVTNDRRPPLLFDDPFVTYDDARAAHAVELLKGLTGDHQILYLTTSERYDAAADRVIVLPAPTAVDTEKAAAAG